jgi:uncharacterized protein YceK
MAFRATCVALLLSSLPIAGCGTVANLARQKPGEGGVTPFGGVHQDMACIENAKNGEVGFKTHHKSDAEQYPRMALLLFCAIDLPFSLVGDVVTWPYTVAYTFINQPISTPPVALIPQPPPQLPPPPPMTEPTTPMTQPTPPGTQPIPIPIPPVAPAKAEGRPRTSP